MKLIKLGVILCPALLLVGCNDENPWANTDGEGHISPIIVTDGSVKEMKPVVRAEEVIETPALEEFRLDLTKKDGSFSKSWQSLADFSEEEMFSVGAYKMEASYGSLEKEGFESPYFYGSAEFEVEEGETSDVNITASLANTMVSIEYTEAFKTYFKSYSTQLHSKGGDYIVFTADETRPAYLRPGEVSLVVSLVKPNGVAGSFEPAVIQTNPRHHYHISLDVNEGEVGEVQLEINFDDTTVTDNVVIDLSDDLMLSEEPILTPEGFDNGVAFDVFECQPADTKKQFSIVADGGLGSVVMTINSAQLLAKGVPTEIDLMTATPAQQALLESIGFNIAGLWKNPDKMGLIDLTNVFKSIEGAGTHEFTIVVKDKLMKVTEPVKLVANTKAVELSFLSAENSKLGTNYADVKLNYNATGFDEFVTFDALNATGTWVKANVVSVSNTGNEYSVRLAIPEGSFDVKVRAKYNGKERSNITVVRQGVTLAVSDYNVWGSKAIVDVTAIPSSTDFNNIELYVSTSGGEYVHHANISRDAANKKITLLGLTPGTKYSVKGSDTGAYESTYPSLEFTTETAQQVGNAGFEEWTTSDFTYKVTWGGNKTTKWYLPWIDENNAWWDVNSRKTLLQEVSAAYANYKVYPTVTYINSGAYQGNCAAQISTVATGTAASEIASGKSFQGEIFIGKANTSQQDAWAYASTGHSFTSRPTSMSFYYQYEYYQNDSFNVVVQVKAADGSVIAENTVSGEQADVSTWTKFDVPLNYTVTNKKAASIFISFKSTTSSSPAVEKRKLTCANGDSDNHYIGSVLRIDDIVLNY